MKSTIFVISILALSILAGCAEQEDIQQNTLVFTIDQIPSRYCDLVAATDYKGEKIKDKNGEVRQKHNEYRDMRIDGQLRTTTLANEFRMLDEAFSEPVYCETNEDCYDYLLETLEYRSVAPEFEPYLNCEKSNKVFDSKPEMFSN